MKLLERIALIKAGYTKAEIAAIEAAEKEPEQDPEQQPETKPDQSDDQEEPEQEQETEEEPEPDYKKLYESTKSQLEAAQKINVNVNVDNGHKDPTPDESFAAWVNENL